MKLLQKIIFAAAILLPHSISAMTYYAIDKPITEEIWFGGSSSKGGAAYTIFQCFTDSHNQRIAIVSGIKTYNSGILTTYPKYETLEVPPYITIGKNSPTTYKVVGIGGTIVYNSKSIECDGFQGSLFIHDVKLPNTITKIPVNAFKGCKELSIINLPSDSLISIGGYAFLGCEKLQSINIPASVTAIGDGAFSGCKNLKSINIPTSVRVIEKRAFSGCESLESINIPASVVIIGDGAFSGCLSLQQIDVDKNSQDFSFANGMLCDVNKNRLIAHCNQKQDSITIPKPIKYIDAGIFRGNTNLRSVTLPSTLIEIGDYAFYGCSRLVLSKDTFSETSLTTIGRAAFKKCTTANSAYYSYESNIYLPNTLRKIGASAFSQCKIHFVSLPISLEEIGDSVFYDCHTLDAIRLPASLSKIGNYTFSKSHISSISLPNSLREIGDYTFAECGSLRSITLPNSLSKIGNHTFQDCTSLGSVTFPNSSSTIGDHTFHGCDNLKSVTLPDWLSTIGDYTFYGCDNLKSVTLPNSLVEIGIGTFSSTRLESISLPINLIRIKDQAFNGCGLSSISFPKNLKEIGAKAFSGCNQLESVSLPESLVSLGPYAFEYCKSLEAIYLPQSLQSIGLWALETRGYNTLNIYAPWTTDVPKFSHDIVDNRWANIGIWDDDFPCSTKREYNDNMTLYIPVGCWKYYFKVDPWLHFRNIKEYDYADIDDVETNVAGSENENSSCEVFNLSGCHVASGENLESARSGLVNGIYIIRFTNGQTRKIVI